MYLDSKLPTTEVGVVTPRYNPVQLHLIEAKKVIEQGWCKYRLHDDNGNHCAVGAILKVEEDLAKRGAALDCLECVVGAFIPSWNNAPERTKEQVLAGFDDAIRIAGERG